MDMMGEPVQQRPSQAFRAENLGPLIEWQVGGHHDRATLVTLAEHLEQQFGTGFAEWHEAELVDDQKLVFCQLFLEAQQALLVPCLPSSSSASLR
jgi:hypothetical protein